MKNINEINEKFTGTRPANYVPLTPISFLSRTQKVFGNKTAVIYGERQYNWQELYNRCLKCADALQKHGLQYGEVVSVIAFNTPEMVELQFAVAIAGGVLNTINTRLDAETISKIIDHAEPRILIVDTELGKVVSDALKRTTHQVQSIINIVDGYSEKVQESPIGSTDYETFLGEGSTNIDWKLPRDEWDAIGLNYTSGTGGNPKGVLIHHRGAYLMAMGTVPAWEVPMHPRYLYTVPMFHCNGWGHAWMLAILAGTMICVRKISAENIFSAIKNYGVTHFGAAPVVLGMMLNAPPNIKSACTHKVKVMTAGAPPPPSVLEQIEKLGFEVTQVYGLTETYGHVVHCAWNSDWESLDFSERAKIKAQQGVQFPHTEDVEIIDLQTKLPVPADGVSQGEIMIQSNTIMKGYHKDPDATEKAFSGSHFHSGDIAVRHPNGYIEIQDRLKDVIISGGENISSVEVENVLYRIPGVAYAAVVAKKDEKWGEVPIAFIEESAESELTEESVISFCRENLAGFKRPKGVIFGPIPKTATGKIQKYLLRQKV